MMEDEANWVFYYNPGSVLSSCSFPYMPVGNIGIDGKYPMSSTRTGALGLKGSYGELHWLPLCIWISLTYCTPC